MDDNAIALAAIGLAATMGGAVIWIAKYFAKELTKDLKAHTKAAQQQVQASKNQTKASKEAAQASHEVLMFMRALNGKVADATISTAKTNKEILGTLRGSAKIAKTAQADGGLLVKTKPGSPLIVEAKEPLVVETKDTPLDVKVKKGK